MENINMPYFQALIIMTLYRLRIMSRSKAQGISLHTEQEIQDMMFKSLRCVSKILGNKKFILGDEPCTDDTSIFGFIAGMVYGDLQHSPFGKLIKGNIFLHNFLKVYKWKFIFRRII